MSQEQQFLSAFDSYADALFRHCYFRTSDRERSLEMVQDTFAKGWEYLQEGKTVVHFRPFLYKILNNLIIDEYRKRQTVSLDAILEDEQVSEGNFEELRDDSAAQWPERIDAQKVHTALAALPEHYREVVTLRYIDGLSPKEIAELVEESENVVSVRIHRGLKQLRRYFEHEND